MKSYIKYTCQIILKLFQVKMRNLMSKGVSRDAFMSELVSSKRPRRPNNVSILNRGIK